MPPVSEKQRRAMAAAAHGRGTLGIPEAVAKEFLGEDAALLFAMPKGEDGLFVEPEAYAPEFEEGERHRREIAAGHFKYADDLGCGNARTFDPKGRYNCGACNQAEGTACNIVEIPAIDRDAGSCGDWETIYDGDRELVLRKKSVDAAVYGVAQNGYGFGCLRCPLGKPATRPDSLGRDWWCGVFAARTKTNACCALNAAPTRPLTAAAIKGAADMALDRNSMRSYDADGRLRVEKSNISKAAVNEYFGREIPDCHAIGLDPDRKYKLLRDPEELEKAAKSFDNLPILSRHVPVSADDHQPDLVIGATGSDAAFDGTYLTNSLIFWTRDAIDDIESGRKRELSCAYRYTPDMTPGAYEGEAYDGVMRDIIGNHVAAVVEGRAGHDVMVGDGIDGMGGGGARDLTAEDANSRSDLMSKTVISRKGAVAKGALLAFLRPRLAQDAKIDVTPLVLGLTHKNFRDRKAGIAAGLKEAARGKLAKDASLDDVAQLLDVLEKEEVEEGMDTDPNTGLPLPKASEEATDDEPTKFLKGKLSAEDWKAYDRMVKDRKAHDEAEEEKKREEEERAKGAADKGRWTTEGFMEGGEFHPIRNSSGYSKSRASDSDAPLVTKSAMDAAIAAATKSASEAAASAAIKTQREIRDAERFVRPWVGDLTIACDSAEDVFRAALKGLSVNVEGIHPSALRAILAAQPLPGGKARPAPAMDAAGSKGFADRFPGADRIVVM